MASSSKKRFPYGMAYYPEQWPRDRWKSDARAMCETGLSVVRMAEFAWSRLEPLEGVWDLEWLVEAVEVFEREGIDVILCTPTASPPQWLLRKHPEVLAVDREGRRAHPGGRRNYCPTKPTYRRYCEGIVLAVAERTRDLPAVIGWQVDNELSGHCFCQSCGEAFRIWLKERYGTLDRLNPAWGTVFWSQEYGDWGEIGPPRIPPPWSAHNPGLLLDYHRFMSDAWVAFFRHQAEILRRENPGRWVTTNLLAFPLAEFDYFGLARHADLATWDNYDLDPAMAAMGHDLCRGLKGCGFWVLEQQLRRIGANPPGRNRVQAYQALARGANGIIHFRWRHVPYGAEQMLPLLFDGDGRPRREHAEIARTGRELARIGGKIAGSAVPAEAAILVSTETLWVSWIQAWVRDRWYYVDLLRDAYRAFWGTNIPVDLAAPDADLAGYRLVIAPYLHVADEELAHHLETYVRSGGCLVLTAGSGQKSRSNAYHEGVPPGPFADLVGAVVREPIYLGDSPEPQDVEMTAAPFSGIGGRANLFLDILEPGEAETIGVVRGGALDGRPTATRRRCGEGQVVYIGTSLSGEFHTEMLGRLAPEAGLEPILETPKGVEAARRVGEEGEFLFVLNHTKEERTVDIPADWRNLLEKGGEGGSVVLEPYGVFCGFRETRERRR